MTKDLTASSRDGLDPRWIGTVYPRDQWHFHQTMLARYGIVLVPGEFSMIVDAIVSGEAPLVERKRKGHAIYSVRITRLWERVFVLARGPLLVSAWPPTRKLNALRRRISDISQAPANAAQVTVGQSRPTPSIDLDCV